MRGAGCGVGRQSVTRLAPRQLTECDWCRRKAENPDMAEVYTAKIEALKRSAAQGEDAAAIQQNKQQLVRGGVLLSHIAAI
jgi:hypothetical protein